MTTKSVGVFCGARGGRDPLYLALAEDVGRRIATAGLRLVYGAGHVGMMGALADGALAEGGHVVGVIPRDLCDRELAHVGLSALHVVDGMHERKALMGAFSDAFLVLPGGFGTLEEGFEVVTWTQLGLHAKPCAFLDHRGYYAGLRAHLDHATAEGFLTRAERGLVRFVKGADEALAWLREAAE